MDNACLAAVPRSVIAAPSRRGALRGLAATLGLVALTPAVRGAKTKRKKKNKCERCPKRICCGCFAATSSPTACRYVETGQECAAFCAGAPGGLGTFEGQQGFTAFCTAGNACVVIECPAV